MATQPAPRDMGAEMRDLIPYLGQLASMQQNAYVKGQQKLTEYQMGRLPTDVPMMAQLQRTETGRDRTGAIDFLRNQGPDARAAAATSNPELFARLAEMNALASNTGLYDELQGQASSDLALGRMLSPEEERDATQAARVGASQRGMATGPSTLAAEILNRNRMGTAREADRRNFALTVEGLRGQQLGYLGSAVSANDSTDPAMKMLGMPSNNQVQGTQSFIQGVRTPDPSGIMGQGLSYGGDLANTNNNAAWSQYYNQQNMGLAQQYGGLGQGGGSNPWGGALSGAASGAAAGTAIMPGWGTAIGGVAGGLAGYLGSS